MSAPNLSGISAFRVRKAFLLPLGILLALAILLFAVSLLQGQPRVKLAVLGMMLLPVVVFFVESLYRKVEVGAEELIVHKFLRHRRMAFREITSVDMLVVRKRAFVTLSTLDGFVILSNAYNDFPALVRQLMARVPDAAISDEARKLAETPPVKSSDIVSCWIAVALLVVILLAQLRAF